jgi:hypothetical protein
MFYYLFCKINMRVLIEEVFRKNNIEINKENKNRFMK